MKSAADIEEMATRFLMQREEPHWTAADEEKLDDWLSADMAHKAAFWRLEHAWQEADRMAALGPGAISGEDFGKEDTSNSLLGELDAHNVIDFPIERRWYAKPAVWMSAVAASLLAVALVFTQPWLEGGLKNVPSASQRIAMRTAPESAQEISTSIGHRKFVELPDGSKIQLNTETHIKASLDEAAREVWLESGEAYFDVKRAAAQKFIVHAGSRRITVLGTKFSVLRDGDEVRVSVVEGKVKVEDLRENAPVAVNVITAGDTIIARRDTALVAKNEGDRVDRDLAWRRGVLTFDQTTLGEAAEQFNRYNTRKLEIADPQTASIRIGGSFKTSNVDAFARLISDAYGLQTTEDGDRIIISD